MDKLWELDGVIEAACDAAETNTVAQLDAKTLSAVLRDLHNRLLNLDFSDQRAACAVVEEAARRLAKHDRQNG